MLRRWIETVEPFFFSLLFRGHCKSRHTTCSHSRRFLVGEERLLVDARTGLEMVKRSPEWDLADHLDSLLEAHRDILISLFSRGALAKARLNNPYQSQRLDGNEHWLD